MKKQTIRLTENELHDIIKETIQTIVQDSNSNHIVDVNSIDISKIDIEILKKAYVDFRLMPKRISHDNVLSNIPQLNEAEGDEMPADNIVIEIRKKYHLDEYLAFKLEANNNIYIYIITACIGENDKLIEDDMRKMGYFLGCKGEIQIIYGMAFQTLQFEPYSQMQNDETKNIKNVFNFLYHWTPEYCIDNILKNGLIPNHQNKFFNYPNRIYLMKGDSSFSEIEKLGRNLCKVNTNEQNNGTYFLLKVDINNLSDDIHFYYDSNSSIGIYTEQQIPPCNIQVINKINFNES